VILGEEDEEAGRASEDGMVGLRCG
jgi:hypothetical protein